MDEISEILEKFPFLSLGIYLEQEYLGIISNSDPQILSMYIYGMLPTDVLRQLFLQLGDTYWWETNRTLPINIAIKDQWSVFRPFLKTFITKEFTMMSGPCVSLDAVMSKRVKRRQIQLIRKI